VTRNARRMRFSLERWDDGSGGRERDQGRQTLLEGAVHGPSGWFAGVVSPLLVLAVDTLREVQGLNDCYVAWVNCMEPVIWIEMGVLGTDVNATFLGIVCG
jgi:hypothetical protein